MSKDVDEPGPCSDESKSEEDTGPGAPDGRRPIPGGRSESVLGVAGLVATEGVSDALRVSKPACPRSRLITLRHPGPVREHADFYSPYGCPLTREGSSVGQSSGRPQRS